MRDYAKETENRVAFIRETVKAAGADGVVFANSGGKDCALVGILCARACENTLSVMLPCKSTRNYNEDLRDARLLTEKFGIESVLVDLGDTRDALTGALGELPITAAALSNIAPRLRMTAMYAIAAGRNALVAGTGNRSERYVGYFTKYGDGGVDFNPIADLTVTEVYEFLRYLDAPAEIINKAPSAGLYEGQTDEAEMGFTYQALDAFILRGEGDGAFADKIRALHAKTEHKRSMPVVYTDS